MKGRFFIWIFISGILFRIFSGCQSFNNREITTVDGKIQAGKMGLTLVHEHVLVDFIGADSISFDRWDRSEVVEVVLPYLQALKTAGGKTLVECTPAYLGRDPVLLKMLSEKSGLKILTNTGLYGARNNKFLPEYARIESANQLADRWITEFRSGIDDTGIKPGFIKIGVDEGNLSEIHQKLITAAAKTHLATGLIIASHTGTATPAFEQIEILEKEGISSEAFIWVHAQAEKNLDKHVLAANKGAWISLDGLHETNMNEYLKMINNLKEHGLLHKVLISHDAGWYSPGKEKGGEFRGYTTLIKRFIPLLKENGYSKEDIDQLIKTNPQEAFAVRIRKL